MKLIITVEDGAPDALTRIETGTGGQSATAGVINAWEQVSKIAQLDAERDNYRELLQQSQAANAKLVEDLAKAKLEQRGWRLPKRGDKVRCVSIPTNPSWTEQQKEVLRIGAIYEVAAPCQCEFENEIAPDHADQVMPGYWLARISYGIQIEHDSGGTSCFTTFPIGCFEPA